MTKFQLPETSVNSRFWTYIGGIASLVSVIAWFGFSLPTPVFSDELKSETVKIHDRIDVVQVDLYSMNVDFINRKIKRLNDQLASLELKILEQESKGSVPDFLVQFKQNVIDEIRLENQKLIDMKKKRNKLTNG